MFVIPYKNNNNEKTYIMTDRHRSCSFKDQDVEFPEFELRDLYYQVAPDADSFISLHKIKDKFGVYNCNTNNIVNVVSDRYHLVNHQQVIKDVEKLIAESTLDITGLERTMVFPKEGNVMFCTYNFPSIEKTMSDGDRSNLQITIINSIDSTRSFELVVGAVRMMCENGQISLSRDASCKLRHFNNYFDESLQQSAYSKALAYINKAAELYASEVKTWEAMKETELLERDINTHLFNACGYDVLYNTFSGCTYVHKLTGKETTNAREDYPKSVKELKSIWDTYGDLDAGLDLYNSLPSKSFRVTTAWRLFNTFTHWSTHVTRKNKDTVTNLQEKRKEITKKIFTDILLDQAA
jgi:hypothetical protein